MAGHVFIAQGDLTKLACDAWLLPCDVAVYVEPHWYEGASPEVRSWFSSLRPQTPPESWGNHGVRVLPPEGWPYQERQPWLVNVGLFRDTPTEWYAEGVRQFLRATAAALAGHEAAYGRAKPLVALPLVGTGRGGAVTIKGDVVRTLMDTLYREAAQSDLDVVLVTHTRPALAAAEYARKQYLSENGGDERGWPDLDAGLRAEARELAAHAARGRLVLFLGAGVSSGAGLPTWTRLLGELAHQANLSDEEQEALARLSPLDQARVVEVRLAAQRRQLGDLVAQKFTVEHYALAHALLAPLPVGEAVTTNYDRLWEMASAAIGRHVAAIPYEAAANGRPWLLKMHGCVEHPEDIVLTRESYIRYADQRSALAGIVQALLITRHMLFVGFSLTDDNFHRIIDAVRKAVRTPAATEPGRALGTALLLAQDPLMEELWREDLRCVNMAPPGMAADDGQTALLARKLEIFLDLLLTEAMDSSAHLLNPAYAGVLSPEDRLLRDALGEFEERLALLPAMCHRSVAWAQVAAFLDALRGKEDPSDPHSLAEQAPIRGQRGDTEWPSTARS